MSETQNAEMLTCPTCTGSGKLTSEKDPNPRSPTHTRTPNHQIP